MRKCVVLAAFIVSTCVTALFAGCGDDSTDTPPAATGGSGGADSSAGAAGTAGTAGSAGASGGSAGSAGQAGAASGPFRVILYEYTGPAPLTSEAYFENYTGTVCAETLVGNCRYQDCRPGIGSIKGVPAGTITISKGTGADVVLSPDVDGFYEPYSSQNSTWKAGDPISIAATGATVPAFSGTLTFPEVVSVTGDVSSRVIDPTVPYEVKWTPTDETVTVFLTQWYGNTPLDQANGICEFPGADGAGSIPAELLAKFDKGLASDQGGLLITHTSTKDATAGSYALRYEARHGVTSWARFLDAPLGGSTAAARQIEAAVLSAPGTANLPIDDVLVTYVKPAGLGDDPGFIVQAEKVGPALFVDTATVTPAITAAVGDRVSFRITAMATSNALSRAAAIADFVVKATAQDISSLRQDLSSSSDLITALDLYSSELVHIEATIAGDWEAAATGHQRVPLTTAGITATALAGQGGLWLRLPTPTFDVSGMVKDCTVKVDAILWRFQKDLQLSSYVPSEVVVTCP
jgi:hypothetical protein